MFSSGLFDDDEQVDELYRVVRSGNPSPFSDCVPREIIEKMYGFCSDILDKKFKSQIKKDFPASFAELYVATTFRCRYGCRVEHGGDKGPDFYLPDKNLHCEVTTITNGEKGLNAIPDPVDGEVYQTPERQIMLRLTSAIRAKFDKIRQYINEGLIGNHEPVIVVVSANGIFERIPFYAEGDFPPVVKALFPVGKPVLWIGVNSGVVGRIDYPYRGSVSKETKDGEKEIETDYFVKDEWSFISAVIYSFADVRDCEDFSVLGNDFIVVHNPLAVNPIDLAFFEGAVHFHAVLNDDGFSLGKSMSPAARRLG